MSGGIYLGNEGAVEISRTGSSTPLAADLTPADVNVPMRRFSFDFDVSGLITGDYVTIRTEDGSNLDLVAGHAFPDWAGYVHVNSAAGVRLYKTFADAIANRIDSAIELQTPSTTSRVLFETEGRLFRYLAKITSYEITTSREAVDLTSLGEEHRQSYASGLISGQGRLTCFWSYKSSICDPLDCERSELSHYLAQLVLRVQQGSDFYGRFYLLAEENEFVWYDAPKCVITNVAIAVESALAVKAQIEFVTSGPVHLLVGQPPGYLLLEDSDFILTEGGERLELEDS